MSVADGDGQRVADHVPKLGKLALDLTADEAVASVSHIEFFDRVGKRGAVDGLQLGHLLIGNQAVIRHERHHFPHNEFEENISNPIVAENVTFRLNGKKPNGPIESDRSAI
jgi:hypothetical protein